MGRCSKCRRHGHNRRTCTRNIPINGQCAICLDRLPFQKTTKLSKCGHIFHSKCLDSWLLIHQTCPLCRVQCELDELPERFVVVQVNSEGRVYWWCLHQFENNIHNPTISVEWGLPDLRPKMVFVEGKTWSVNTESIHRQYAEYETLTATELFEATIQCYTSMCDVQFAFRTIPRPPDIDSP